LQKKKSSSGVWGCAHGEMTSARITGSLAPFFFLGRKYWVWVLDSLVPGKVINVYYYCLPLALDSDVCVQKKSRARIVAEYEIKVHVRLAFSKYLCTAS
jgi:hypothetical protein